MKNKLLLKTTALFIITVFVIYTMLTYYRLYNICNLYQLNLFSNKITDVDNLDKLKLEGLGNNIEQKVNDTTFSNYNVLGYYIWQNLQVFITNIFNYYICISILLGISISIGYLILNTFKFKFIIKIIFGYIVPTIFLLILYFLIFNKIKNPIMTIEDRNICMKIFLIINTAVFFVMFFLKNRNTKKADG